MHFFARHRDHTIITMNHSFSTFTLKPAVHIQLQDSSPVLYNVNKTKLSRGICDSARLYFDNVAFVLYGNNDCYFNEKKAVILLAVAVSVLVF